MLCFAYNLQQKDHVRVRDNQETKICRAMQFKKKLGRLWKDNGELEFFLGGQSQFGCLRASSGSKKVTTHDMLVWA